MNAQNLIIAGKARAILKGRYYVSTDDVRAVAHPVLRHRVLTNFNAEADGIHSDDIVSELLKTFPADASTAMEASMAKRVFSTNHADSQE